MAKEDQTSAAELIGDRPGGPAGDHWEVWRGTCAFRTLRRCNPLEAGTGGIDGVGRATKSPMTYHLVSHHYVVAAARYLPPTSIGVPLADTTEDGPALLLERWDGNLAPLLFRMSWPPSASLGGMALVSTCRRTCWAGDSGAGGRSYQAD